MCAPEETRLCKSCASHSSVTSPKLSESSHKGFEAFVTKGYRGVDVGHQFVMNCSERSCENLCTSSYQKECTCTHVWYCSEGCEKSDTTHRCDSRSPRARGVESEKVQARMYVGGLTFDREAVFTGVKKGKKYVRGEFVVDFPPTRTFKNGQRMFYVGQLSTVKVDGVVSIIADGKGAFLTSWVRHVGKFSMGRKTGIGHVKTISGVTMRGNWENDVATGIHEMCRDGYEAFGSMKETEMKATCTSRDVHDSWKKTEETVCLEKKGPFGKLLPVIIKKSDLINRFDHWRVVGIETVGKVKFRKTVHWTGEDGPHGYCTDGPLLSFSSSNACSSHGQWNYGSICPSMTTIPREDVVLECTCHISKLGDAKNQGDSNVSFRPAPSRLPKIRRCKGGRSNKSLKNTHVDRDISIRGVSKRDMSRDVGDVPGDLDTALEEGGWGLTNRKNHFKFSRVVDGRKQNFVCSKSPSDKRSRKNDLAMMKNLSRRL